jgi:phosphatidylglycerophosphate synthase
VTASGGLKATDASGGAMPLRMAKAARTANLQAGVEAEAALQSAPTERQGANGPGTAEPGTDGLDASARDDRASPADGPSRPRWRRRKLREAGREASDAPFERAARWLLARGVHPNHLTFLQLPVYAMLIVCAANGGKADAEAYWAYLFVGLNLLVPILDGGDGILARVGKLQSKAGALLDTTFDTLGIAIVMWGAAQFLPEAALWIMLLFLGSIVLFLQNALLDQKVISYVRGPVLISIAYEPVLLGALVVAGFVTAWLILWRTPATFRALGRLMPVQP